MTFGLRPLAKQHVFSGRRLPAGRKTPSFGLKNRFTRVLQNHVAESLRDSIFAHACRPRLAPPAQICLDSRPWPIMLEKWGVGPRPASKVGRMPHTVVGTLPVP